MQNYHSWTPAVKVESLLTRPPPLVRELASELVSVRDCRLRAVQLLRLACGLLIFHATHSLKGHGLMVIARAG